jgi:hypothetical protein
VDVKLERGVDDYHKFIKFPYNTPIHFLVTKEKSRINRYHNVSIFLDKETSLLSIGVPSNEEIIRTLLLHREIEGKLITLPVREVYLSNTGQKLAAFLNLFGNGWDTADQFVSDHFC